MKSTYQIKFKRGKRYSTEYVRMLLKGYESIINGIAPEVVLDNFIAEYDSFIRRSKKQWDKFVQTEGFSLNTPLADLDPDAKALVKDLAPVFCMCRDEKLIKQLESIGFYPIIQKHFINSDEIHKSIDTFISNLRLGSRQHVGLLLLVHQIALIKCALIIEEAVGDVKGYKNRESVVKSKIIAENLKRTFSKGRTPRFLRTSKARRYYLQFKLTEKILTAGNVLAKRNHRGSYNLRHLSVMCYKPIRDILPKEEFKDNDIIIHLFDVFKVLFREQNPYENTEQWELRSKSLNPKNAPKGDNYRKYQLNWVKTIIGYSTVNKLFKDDSDYINPNPSINPLDVLDAFE